MYLLKDTLILPFMFNIQPVIYKIKEKIYAFPSQVDVENLNLRVMQAYWDALNQLHT